jgi:hypothetical protein
LSASLGEGFLKVDRAGSAVFKALLRLPDSKISDASVGSNKELIPTNCWYLWWQRRQIVHNEPVTTPVRSALAIMAISTNYVRSCKANLGIRRGGWENPNEGYTKLNVDASFYAEYFSGATGAVIRDDHGGFFTGSCCSLPSVADVVSAEARALRDGLLLAGQVGCSKLIVDSDCMEVISTMLEGGNSIGAAAAIYEECSFLSRGFSHVIFIHCARESNKVAHMLACKAEGPQSIVWLEDPPDFLTELLTDDVTIF